MPHGAARDIAQHDVEVETGIGIAKLAFDLEQIQLRVVEDREHRRLALRELARTWEENGDSARQILLAQKLGGLVARLMETVSALPINKVTFIDRGLAGSEGNGNLAVRAAVTSEQLKHTIGVDVPELLRKITGGGSGGNGEKPGLPGHK